VWTRENIVLAKAQLILTVQRMMRPFEMDPAAYSYIICNSSCCIKSSSFACVYCPDLCRNVVRTSWSSSSRSTSSRNASVPSSTEDSSVSWESSLTLVLVSALFEVFCTLPPVTIASQELQGSVSPSTSILSHPALQACCSYP
jgi:hypothetical protein